MKHWGANNLTPVQHFMRLKTNAASMGFGTLEKSVFCWHFSISPSPISRQYALMINFKNGERPKIFVESPSLIALSGDRTIPHVYRQNPTELCLHLPKQWKAWMPIDQTIVPWAALWLWYFEEWLFSGEWKGGGEHPSPSSNRQISASKIASLGRKSTALKARYEGPICLCRTRKRNR